MTVHKKSVIGDLNSDQNNQQPFFSSAATWSLQKEVYDRGSQPFLLAYQFLSILAVPVRVLL